MHLCFVWIESLGNHFRNNWTSWNFKSTDSWEIEKVLIGWVLNGQANWITSTNAHALKKMLPIKILRGSVEFQILNGKQPTCEFKFFSLLRPFGVPRTKICWMFLQETYRVYIQSYLWNKFKTVTSINLQNATFKVTIVRSAISDSSLCSQKIERCSR